MRNVRQRSVSVLFVVFVACVGLVHIAAAADQMPAAVLIRVGDGDTPEVILINEPPGPEMLERPGLIVWSEQGREHWRTLPRQKAKIAAPEALAMGSRFEGANRADSGGGAAMATLQLAQLRGLQRLRGGFFLTPTPRACLLDPKITIRRRAVPGKMKYPAIELLLLKRRKVLARVSFKEDQAKVAWSDIPDLAKSLEDGLPPGRYTLRVKDDTEEVEFHVADAATKERILQRPNRLAELLGTKEHPLYLLVAVEHLLSQVDADGSAMPCMADALDLLETAPPALLTPYLRRSRDEIVARLSGKSLPTTGKETDAPTGIKPIDEARMLITEGKWAAAQTILDSMPATDSPRAQALATLYRAVIQSESGQATEEQTSALFNTAILALHDGRPEDRFRVHNNYANYLFGRTQDRLYNHAFQIASGVKYPLIHALVSWREACLQYGQALALAEKLDRPQRAAVEVNLARLYSLLADVIRTLDVPVEGKRKFTAGQRAAATRARQLAETAIKTSDTTDPLTHAIGHELLSHLAFRGDDDKGLQDSARQAMQEFLQAGSLPGVEGVQRLLGLWYMRQAASADGKVGIAEARQAALRHLKIAQLLAELLREQIPTDQIGLGRAGFFARRAYVNESIIELLLAEDKFAEALQYAELAKARALQDVMAAGSSKATARANEPTDLSHFVSDWPKEVAAVEYFLGSERAWVFLINTSGQVSAYPLQAESGRPTKSRDLVARISRFLALQFPGSPYTHAKKMAIRWRSGKGVDHSWQDELYAFQRELLPEPVIKELRGAKTVLIVPHHVLHYFPFVALVTQPDRKRRADTEMVEPTFLLDESFDICYAPSLTTWCLARRNDSRPISEVNGLGIVDFGANNRLPGVEKDMANLKAVFGNRLRELVPGDDATETAAKELCRRPGLLFVGTHGANVADRPLSSFLVLQSDATDDGRLTAEELYANEVAADLVVMSACYSGLADRSPLPGDDLFGLQRALLHSRARTVVSGLWDVYDGTAPELMRGFFQQLMAGLPAPAALANSQRAFLKAERGTEGVKFWLHPYFWAVYTVAGDDRTRFDIDRP